MTIYQAIYEVITPYAKPYATYYPFQNNAIDFRRGYCSFFELYRKNLTSGERKQLIGGISHVSATVEIDMQINLTRWVNYKDALHNAPEMASKLQAYLKSYDALNLFYEKGYDMAPVWGDIMTDGFWMEQKKWAQKAHFDMKFYALNEIEIPSEPLKYIQIEKIEEI